MQPFTISAGSAMSPCMTTSWYQAAKSCARGVIFDSAIPLIVACVENGNDSFHFMHLACAKLLSWLEKGVAIVTPTPLLARIAGYQFSLEQLRQGRESWERPAIQTIGAWLAARWQEARSSASDVPVLLSPS